MKRIGFIKICAILLIFAMAGSIVACVNSGGNETEGSDSVQSSETESQESSETGCEEPSEEAGIDLPETNLELGEEVEYASAFTVSQVFSSDMVVQRNECIRVWGWAEESENGKKVSATFMGEKADALIENGEWEIIFYQRYEACKELGNDLKVYGAEDAEYIFEDILIGDVFMVVGQSNVQYDVNSYLGAESDLKWTKDQLSDDSIIRFNYNSNTQSGAYPERGSDEVVKDAISGYGWVKPNANNIGALSAIGYFIAHQVTELTNNGIPVGISQFSASGRPLSVFMPNELAETLGSDRFDEDKNIYVDNHYAHVEARYMYNHFMYAYERMPIAGIVWYQGEAESNPALSTVYAERFTALMEYMRSTHNIVNKEFPVFYVEFPSVYRVQLPDGSFSGQYLDTGRIRAESCMIPQYLSNSYIAVCSDLWNDEENTNNIHPYCKYEQAERVSALMNAVIYGGATMEEAAGPVLDSYEISADNKTMIIKFKNVGDGLKLSDGSTEIKGFGAIDKRNSITSNVTLTIEITGKDTITITSKKAFSGVAYNYIYDNFFGDDVNLCDSDGTPAHAFWIYFDPRAK